MKAVFETKRPEDLQSLRAFLGLVNYYGKFIPRLASVAAPLYHLLKKEAPWRWTSSQEESWKRMKELLSSAEVLCAYNPTLPLTLSCDASPFGVTAVLAHRFPDGSERPVAYASKSLSPAEKNYSQLDKEALAIVFGVKRFHAFLYGRSFTLITRLQHRWKRGDAASSELSPFLTKRNDLALCDGVILWGRRVVVPTKLRPEVLDVLHETHAGAVRMKALARSFVWWTGIRVSHFRKIFDFDVGLMKSRCTIVKYIT